MSGKKGLEKRLSKEELEIYNETIKRMKSANTEEDKEYYKSVSFLIGKIAVADITMESATRFLEQSEKDNRVTIERNKELEKKLNKKRLWNR